MIPAHFALKVNIGGQTKPNRNKETKYLMEDQAKHIYKKIKSENIINIGTIKQGIDQDQELNRLDDTSERINPYRKLITCKTEKVDTILSQMEQLLLTMLLITYNMTDIQRIFNLDIKTVNQKSHKKRPNTEEERQI